MKLKAGEIFFLAVVIAVAAAGMAIFLNEHYRGSSYEIDLSTPEDPGTLYPVEVINSATAEDLMQVSGIGEQRAGEIIKFREAIGGFKRVEQLKEISGIGESVYQNILDYFYPEPGATASLEDTEPEAEPEVTSPKTEEEPKPQSTEPPEKTERKTEAETSAEPEPEPETESVSEAEPEITKAKEMRAVNINSASAEEIAESLDIDFSLAGEIVALRERIHGFSTVEELYLIDTMDKETYQKIKDFILF